MARARFPLRPTAIRAKSDRVKTRPRRERERGIIRFALSAGQSSAANFLLVYSRLKMSVLNMKLNDMTMGITRLGT